MTEVALVGLQFAQHGRLSRPAGQGTDVEIEGVAQAQTIDDDIGHFLGDGSLLVGIATATCTSSMMSHWKRSMSSAASMAMDTERFFAP